MRVSHCIKELLMKTFKCNQKKQQFHSAFLNSQFKKVTNKMCSMYEEQFSSLP